MRNRQEANNFDMERIKILEDNCNNENKHQASLISYFQRNNNNGQSRIKVMIDERKNHYTPTSRFENKVLGKLGGGMGKNCALFFCGPCM